jgi:hypothetical protein
MDLSRKSKFIIFVMILVVFVLGVAMFGPKFITKLQIEFGMKGKIMLIEECLAMPGCAISTDELDIYNHYIELEKNQKFKDLEETEVGRFLLREGMQERE